MHWKDYFPPHLRPRESERDRVNKLETLRVELGIPHETFAELLAGSRWMTRRTLGVAWNSMLGMSERERISQLYHDRAQNAARMGIDYPALPSTCNSLEKLTDFVIQVEKQYAQPDVYGWGRRLDDALE
jgi:hypothetical protein